MNDMPFNDAGKLCDIGYAVCFIFGQHLKSVISLQVDKKVRRRAIVFLVMLSSLLIFCMIFPALIFMAVESWTYHEAFYYSFITLTTIGFGDFVVGKYMSWHDVLLK